MQRVRFSSVIVNQIFYWNKTRYVKINDTTGVDPEGEEVEFMSNVMVDLP